MVITVKRINVVSRAPSAGWFDWLKGKGLRTYFNDHPFPVNGTAMQTSPVEVAFRWNGLSYSKRSPNLMSKYIIVYNKPQICQIRPCRTQVRGM